jgi:hypothetical protein
LILTLALCVLSGCRVDPPGEIVLIPVLESSYRVGMREVLIGDQRELRFHLSTSEARQCSQARIENLLFRDNQLIQLDLRGIAQPAGCTPGTSDAATETERLVLDADLFTFRIRLGESVSNDGLLRKASDRYLLDLQERTGIELESEALLFLPTDLVWGYVNFADAGAANAIQERIQSDLTDLGAQAVNLQKGYYGYFRTTNGSSLLIPGADEQSVTFAYRLPENDNAATLSALADAWRTDLGPTVTVGLFNTQGEQF